jgi:hypothetical protein
MNKPLSFATALSGVVRTGRPLTTAHRFAAVVIEN